MELDWVILRKFFHRMDGSMQIHMESSSHNSDFQQFAELSASVGHGTLFAIDPLLQTALKESNDERRFS
jgi:hypothetical protein